MILTLAKVKTQLRLEPEFVEHDELLNGLIKAAQRSIERNYYCTLVATADELESLTGVARGFIADDDIQLAMQMMIAQWYSNPTGTNSNSDTPENLGAHYLLFPLTEHTV